MSKKSLVFSAFPNPNHSRLSVESPAWEIPESLVKELDKLAVFGGHSNAPEEFTTWEFSLENFEAAIRVLECGGYTTFMLMV